MQSAAQEREVLGGNQNPKIKNKCELPWVEKPYRRVKIEININPVCKESRVRKPGVSGFCYRAGDFCS